MNICDDTKFNSLFFLLEKNKRNSHFTNRNQRNAKFTWSKRVEKSRFKFWSCSAILDARRVCSWMHGAFAPTPPRKVDDGRPLCAWMAEFTGSDGSKLLKNGPYRVTANFLGASCVCGGGWSTDLHPNHIQLHVEVKFEAWKSGLKQQISRAYLVLEV